MRGITGFGAYVPKYKLLRKAIADANSWFDPGLIGRAKGARSMCHWDEDAITMGVESSQSCLNAMPENSRVEEVLFASTSAPFLDRQSSVLIAEAMNFSSGVRSMDVAGSQRAATSALIQAFGNSQNSGHTMVVASEHRVSKVGSRQELMWGDGSAAIAVGVDDVVAECRAFHSISIDFIDHYRTQESVTDYEWEERWIREEGYLALVPEVIEGLNEKYPFDLSEVNHFVLPCEDGKIPTAVAKKLGIPEEAVAENLLADCGLTGVAHPLLMLSNVLERAGEGETILVVGFGQGCDAILLIATNELRKLQKSKHITAALEGKFAEENYNKFLSFTGQLNRDLGKRAEIDRQSYLSVMYRNRDFINGFVGGKCESCGTVQIPRMPYCVNPDCNGQDTQTPYEFRRKHGQIVTWTADSLTFDWNPPAYFGLVEFDGGGRLMMDIIQVDGGSIETGTEVSVHFRIKHFDNLRGFRRYFWKAIPESVEE